MLIKMFNKYLTITILNVLGYQAQFLKIKRVSSVSIRDFINENI